MNEEKYMNDFNIISMAGMSKSQSLMAVKEAKAGNIEKAKEYLQNAEETMGDVHALHLEMLQQECSGNSVDVTIVTVHAQDHVTMALMMHEMANEMIDLYERVGKLEKR